MHYGIDHMADTPTPWPNTPPLGRHSPWPDSPLCRQPPLWQTPPPSWADTAPAYGQWLDGTHPTGMHSFLNFISGNRAICYVAFTSIFFVRKIFFRHMQSKINKCLSGLRSRIFNYSPNVTSLEQVSVIHGIYWQLLTTEWWQPWWEPY